jgi:tight adherence protein C
VVSSLPVALLLIISIIDPHYIHPLFHRTAGVIALGVGAIAPAPPRTLLGYRVLAAIVFPVLILLLGSASGLAVVLALAMIGLGWMLPLMVVRRRARLRIDRIDRALPDLVDLLVVTVEAGLGFSGSLRVAADQFAGPLSDELRLTLQEQAMGLAMSDALVHLLRRADTPSMRSFVRSVIQGESLGVSTGTIMRNIAVEMRKRRRKAAEERAQKAPIKLLFPLVFLIFPTMFIVLLPAVFSLQSALGG